MKRLTLFKTAFSALSFILLISACVTKKDPMPQTEITKWAYGKKGAVSLTYDDGSINQFRNALPIMNDLDLKATFFIITGQIPGSQYQGKFIGRPVETIIAETASIPTNEENFFERASAAGFLGYKGTLDYHTSAGAAIDANKKEEAYKIIDDLYKKVRSGDFKVGHRVSNESIEAEGVTWDHIRSYAAQGHEFASHTVTHPRLAALDETNMVYELEKSKEDILNQLGADHTFSVEGPYGTEDERVMDYIHKIYPASRNRMPESYLLELNRSSRLSPTVPEKEYVQWQRGATTKTPLPLMKTWIDTVATNDNNWLVLVFHGVDGIGWESLTSDHLKEYFEYIKAKEDDLWVATFGDVTKYMRQRMSAKLQTSEKNGDVFIEVRHSLDNSMYNMPLTLKTYVASDWKHVKVTQDENEQVVLPQIDEKGAYILYQVNANSEPVRLSNSTL